MKKQIWILLGLAFVGISSAASAQSVCTINTYSGRGYTGYGYDRTTALNDARNTCIRGENNSRVCMDAPYSCYDQGYPPPAPPPQPPVPPPPPPPQYASCTVYGRWGRYVGYGYGVNQALDSARDQCTYRERDRWSCYRAPFNCNR